MHWPCEKVEICFGRFPFDGYCYFMIMRYVHWALGLMLSYHFEVVDLGVRF